MLRPRNKLKENYKTQVYLYLHMSNQFERQGKEEQEMSYFKLYLAKRVVFITLVSLYECMKVEQVEELVLEFEHELRKEESNDSTRYD